MSKIDNIEGSIGTSNSLGEGDDVTDDFINELAFKVDIEENEEERLANVMRAQIANSYFPDEDAV